MKNTTISRIRKAVSLSMRQCYFGLLTLFVFMSASLGYSQGTIGIGSGSGTNSNIPLNSCMGYNYTQQIVTAAEYAQSGGVAGNITKIRYYFAGGVSTFTNFNTWTVYIGHTSKTEFSSTTDWESLGNLTQVYSGTITPVANNWMEITFTTPFNYNGTSNLIVAVDENLPSWNCTASWGTYTSGANTGIYYNNDSTNPDPASPPAGTRTSTIARLQFVGQLASCLPPTGITAAASSTTNATVNWAASTTVPANGYEYYYSATNTAPTAGTTPSGTTGAGVLTAPLSGLTSNTTYYVWVRSACDATTNSSWSAVASFTTPCDPTDVPYTQNFESVTTPAIPECTTIQNAGTGNNWNTITNPGYGFATKTLRYSYNSANAANAWFYTRGINLTAGTSYRIAYRYGNNSTFYVEKLKVAYGTANNAAAMTTILADHASISTAAATNTFVDFVPATTGVYYFGFNAYSIANQDQLYVDNIVVNLTPTCEAATAVAGVASGFTTANVTWTASASNPADGYEYYVATTNTAPTAGATPTGTVAAGVTTLDLTGLTASTNYYVWVRAVCGASDKSAWAGPATFFTGYCTPAPSTVDDMGITNVVLGTITNPTGTETGNYGNYSTLSTDVALGSTVNFAITFETGYTYDTKIWVDWNNDADFNDAGEEVYSGTSLADNPTTLTGSFMVPADAAMVGSHRVRIGGIDAGPPTPCYTGSWGSYEDYTINAFMPPAPIVTGFTPATYCAETGDITITGTDLANATLTIGGTAVTITTNTNTEITATVPAGVSGVVAVTTVAGTSTTVDTFTVTQPTALELSSAAASICEGETTGSLTITVGASAYDTYVWTPSAGITGDAATGWVFTPDVTTTYTLTASQSAGPCVVNIEYVVAVNQLPNDVVITPATADVCLNGTVALTHNGVMAPVTGTYCVPTVTNGGSSGDFINNFTFANVTNNASGDTASDFTFYSALTANVTAGQTYNVSVQSGSSWGQNFRMWIDYNHDGVFSAAESVFNTTAASTLVQNGTVTIPATAFNGVTRMRIAARYGSTLITSGEACGHGGFGEYEDYNVNITGATEPAAYEWTPVTGLYTDEAATTPYTGGFAQTVYAMVTETTPVTYTVTATTDAGCTAVGTTTLTPVITPAPTGDAAVTLCSGATVANLTATGDNIQWYTSATGGTALAADAVLNNGAYYATQTMNGCESVERMMVAVSLTVIPAPTVDNDVQIFCNEGTVGQLMANGTGILWYTSATGGEALDPSTAIEEGVTVFYGSQTVDGCESQARVALAALVNIFDAPIVVESTQTFCAGSGVTVADLMVYGQDITWYADATTDTPLADDTVLESGVTYYASQTIATCESAERVAVTAMFNVTPAPAANAEQYFCNEGTVGDLMATGDNIQWYADAEGGEALTADTMLTDGMMYYASQTVNDCEGTERTMVTAYVSAVAAPTGTATQEIGENVPGTATIEQIVVDGEGIVWYATEEDALNGTNPLEQGTLIESGSTYYATQTVGDCTSAPFAVMVTVTLGGRDFDAAAFKYYPNPIKDVLNISYSSDITSVTVFNLLGQQVITKDVNAASGTIDMSVLQDGTYIVNVTSGDSVKTIKVIKKQ